MPVRHDEHSWLLLIWILKSSHFLQRFATLHSKSSISWRSEPSLEELRPSDPSWQSIPLDPLSWRPLIPEAEKRPKSHAAWWWWVILPSFGSCAQAFLSSGECRLLSSQLRCSGFSLQKDGFSCCRAGALDTWASVAVVQGLSYLAACGIFPE